ncbi:MAG: UvrD-helicase domain-containing protein [Candidatus Eisenbacteria bacterium]
MSAAAVNPPLPIPVVADADIEVAERYLGVSFDEPRRQILRSNDSFDVQACPGSGKTTLLVAKLAILGAKWPHARRGICVLSHTNVARQEIESKLAGTAVGHRLLAYPHFVGTIHGFVNEFLALPLLRSEGHHVRLIDDETHGEFCKGRLYSVGAYAKAELYLKNREQHSPDRTIRALRYEGSDLTLGSAAGSLPCGAKSDSWKILDRIKREAVSKGFWRFDDMFAWAERLLAMHPKVAEFARWRFPAVFLDETQDTSELQGSLLNKIFPVSACDLRQRFGDSNQAIYDFGQRAATTDRFPSAGYRSLPNSQRFGPSIAAKAYSLAVVPTSPSLTGKGPRKNVLPRALDSAAMPHTIFLFAPNSAQQVLPAFGSLLLQTFPDEVLRCDAFLARAIARVGRSEASDEKVPRHLGDYWTAYEPRVAKLEPRPEHLVDYVHLAQRRRVATVDCAESIRMVVKGICELIEIVQPAAIPRGGHAARWLWEAHQKDESSVVSLRRLLWEWCIETTPIVEERWTDKVTELRCALSQMIGRDCNSGADAFCEWSMDYAEQTSSPKPEGPAAPNRYRLHQNGRYVDIDVGTIHSAKGQTHTATLVLESLFKKHDMQDLLRWICGKNCNAGSRPGTELTERMRLVYTAMTRPSHLLCLAMRRDAVTQDGAEAETRQQLEQLGWTVKDLGTCEGAS